MQEYYFLFAIALIWTVAAAVQDLKSREVSNWLNFSLVAFALAYRTFYAALTNEYTFFIFGILGFTIFFALGHALYYSKAFAGGDAKLLIAYGAVFPYTSYTSILHIPILFILLLFSVGAAYSLLYSLFIIIKNKEKFSQELKKRIKKYKNWLTISTTLSILAAIFSFKNPIALFPALVFLIPLLYTYAKSFDHCMIVLLPAKKLTEGDWLEKEVRIGSYVIKKSVHGLSREQIKFLTKRKKKVLIKQGIPFIPAFLISLVITVFFFVISKSDPASLIFSLF